MEESEVEKWSGRCEEVTSSAGHQCGNEGSPWVRAVALRAAAVDGVGGAPGVGRCGPAPRPWPPTAMAPAAA